MAPNVGIFKHYCEAVFERYSETTPLLILILTAGILFLEGLAMAYQMHLREVLTQTFTLSVLNWTAFISGPFLIEPLLLFGVLYGVRSRRQQTLSLTALLPGLIVAVIVGSLSGQYFGLSSWPVVERTLPVLVLFSSHATVLSPYGVHAWFVLVEPLVYDLLIVVAALTLAEIRQLRV